MLTVDNIDRYVDPQGNDLPRGQYYELKQRADQEKESKIDHENIKYEDTTEGMYSFLKSKINPNQFDALPIKPFEPLPKEKLFEDTVKSIKTWIPVPLS